MNRMKSLQFGVCLFVATVLALTSHIYISQGVKPFLDSLLEGLGAPPPYSSLIITSAYVTALIKVGLVIFLYYHTQHLLLIKSKLMKALVVACILLELNGNLIRQPIMNILVNYSMGMEGLKPYLFEALNTLDKWVSSFLLALSLVYLCPQKYKETELKTA